LSTIPVVAPFEKSCDDKDIAIRVIRTEQQGAWMAVVNTSSKQKNGIKIRVLNSDWAIWGCR